MNLNSSKSLVRLVKLFAVHVLAISAGILYGRVEMKSNVNQPSPNSTQKHDSYQLFMLTENGNKPYLCFKNNSDITVWFPFEVEPNYRYNKEEKKITIWYGYFDEPLSSHREHYMLPAMKAVAPGNELKIPLHSQVLTELVIKGNNAISIKARVSRIELIQSSVRGEQPLDKYEQNSFLISSKE